SMRSLSGLLSLLLIASASFVAPAAEPPRARISELIEKLGSPIFTERAKAAEALIALGKPAEEAVRQATQGPDAERRRRAEDVLKEIENRLLVARLLGPTRLRLALNDVPLREALNYLASIGGGQAFVFDFDPSDPQIRQTVTLDSGETTFWEAFDQLCRSTGLKEQ